MTGDDGVLDDRVRGGDQLHPHHADVHPSAAGELEVLGHAAIEHQAFCCVIGVGEFDRVADAVEAFLVERRLGEVGALVIAGRDVGAAHAHFALAAGRNELQLAACDRQPDHAGAIDVKVHRGRERRGLGRTPRREHLEVAALLLLPGEAREPVPQVLRQRRRGVEQHVEAAKEVAPQLGVLFEEREQQVVAARHVEVHGGRDLLEIAHRGLDQPRHRLAAVDVECAAVAQHRVEVVVAAEGVVPG